MNQEIDSTLGSFSSGLRFTNTDNGVQPLLSFNIKYLTEQSENAHQLLFEIISKSIINLTDEELAKLVEELKNELKNNL